MITGDIAIVIIGGPMPERMGPAHRTPTDDRHPRSNKSTFLSQALGPRFPHRVRSLSYNFRS